MQEHVEPDPRPAEPATPEAAREEAEASKPKTVYVAAAFMGLVIGFFSAWATLNMGDIAGFAFIGGFIGGTWYLSKRALASDALGTGCYITSALMVVTPVLFYLPNIVAEPGGGAEEAGAFVGSVLGIFIWSVVFFFVAIVTLGIGYALRKRAAKKLRSSP